MFRRFNNKDAWYIAIVMACGFITFYSLPDVIPLLGRLKIMALVQARAGAALIADAFADERSGLIALRCVEHRAS